MNVDMRGILKQMLTLMNYADDDGGKCITFTLEENEL